MTDNIVHYNADQFKQARLARDKRFDGRFFVAVKTTHIFCRPICPATLPKEENVEYFIDRAQAVQAGYRPCLRCRPDSAPHSNAWNGTETTLSRAVSLIQQGILHTHSLTQLSDKLGISDRYLRQLFDHYLGMSPKQYALNHQLLFAKQLLHSSNLSVTDIGYASGFNSIRRFNDAFKKTLKLTPSELRRTPHSHLVRSILIPFQGTLNWSHMMDFYRLRVISGIESVENDIYARHCQLGESNVFFKLSPYDNKHIQMQFELDDISQLQQLVNKVRQMFDLDANTSVIEDHLRHIDPDLVQTTGLRIPGVWSQWEAGVRAILGQQVSVKGAITQLNRFIAGFSQQNKPLQFPTPLQVAKSDLNFMRLPQARKDTLVRLAQFLVEAPDAPVKSWLEIKGIGPWTVNYATLRSQSDPDCYLEGDLIVKKVSQRFPNLNGKTASPWGSYATFHLWNLA
ncbi:DNA-3-methyladenine glycosylase 2 family protein [Vibrio ulleungensis]|uniref:DNA-3-methyladenine glycosylase 2 family protein n=1 Tax=Vibrio ulleungensis TaxID=2807619 RepID=A0ABS2HLU0_9VIBR|nr:Ada metal-binding domain-containing protein [Vibrio ulleungensis]MBM7037178.1 DNA-3-methyladenine glycosylase 2 family protein [Vibrio ulleungensis]